MSLEATPKLEPLPYGGFISTIFTFDSPKTQNAANTVYFHKSTVDAEYLAANPIRPKKYNFKTNNERMQYIIGQQGSVPGASGW